MHLGKHTLGQKTLCTCSLLVESTSASLSLSQLQMSYCTFSNGVSLIIETASVSSYILKRMLQSPMLLQYKLQMLHDTQVFFMQTNWIIPQHSLTSTHQFLTSNLCTVPSHDCSLENGSRMKWSIVVCFIVGASYFVQFRYGFLSPPYKSILSHGSGLVSQLIIVIRS